VNALFKLLGLKEEYYPSYLNCLSIKWDRIPKPTREERTIDKVPTTCRKINAMNWLAWFILRRFLYRRLSEHGHACMALLTESRCLEIFPLPLGIHSTDKVG